MLSVSILEAITICTEQFMKALFFSYVLAEGRESTFELFKWHDVKVLQGP